MNPVTTCLICSEKSAFLFQADVLGKYAVSYFKCEKCDFIQTEKPYWLDEAYGAAISSLDVGLVSRNLSLAERSAQLIKETFDCRARFLDYAGGYGLFVRLMRDKGFDFYREERHCPNIFAQNLDLKDLAPDGRFELVTAFEVFEHLVDPVAEIKKMFCFSDSVLFSTALAPKTIREAKDWWYFVPETGQHISFFNNESLEILAKRLDCYLFSDRSNLHLLTKRQVTNPFLKKTKPIFTRAAEKYLSWASPSDAQLESLLGRDFETAKQRKLKGASGKT